MQNNIRALQAFEAVARHLSISKAAEEMRVTQSAVSHQLRRLNERLGEKLLVKNGRGIALTPTGRDLADRLRTAFGEIERSITSVIGAHRGTLRLAVCSSFGPGWLIHRLIGFTAQHPAIELQLQMYAQDPELTDQVADAFVTTYPTRPGFWTLPIMHELLLPVLSPTARIGSTRRPPLITTELDPGSEGADWRHYCEQADVDMAELFEPPWLKCTHYLFAKEMALAGLGIALVPDFLVAEDLGAGRLMALSETRLPTHQDYYLCIKEARRNEPPLTALARWFKAMVKEVAGPQQ